MSGKRNRRILSVITAAVAATALSGCVQATRHSNAIVFGTNTSFGIKVGPNATSTPSVVVGYDRQEAVLLPVVANSGEAESGGNNGNLLTPCDPSQAVATVGQADFVVHPCSLVAVRGNAMDSYSVLASFGAKFSGNAGSGGPEASGGLAQYFSTGMASQLLALTGGASVVAVGDAAARSAENQPEPQTVSALFGQDSNFQTGVALGGNYVPIRDDLLARIRLTDAANLPARITAFEQAIGWSGPSLSAACADKSRCLARARDYYSLVLPGKATEAGRSLTTWAIP